MVKIQQKVKICEYCGESYKPNKYKWSVQRFCSEECQRSWWAENREWASQEGKFVFTCQNCGEKYKTKYSDRNTCCSRKCGFEWQAKQAIIDKECLSCGNIFKGTQSGTSYCSETCQSRGAKNICQVCGTEFYGHPNSSYCSHDCELQIKRQRYEEYMLKKNEKRFYICAECRKGFKAPYGDKRHKYCSLRCARRANKRRRRAQKYGNGDAEYISPIKVFERDEWLCGICHTHIDPQLTYPHPYSASLDHIIPLSCGGRHTLDNVQLAHLICNIRKSNDGEV